MCSREAWSCHRTMATPAPPFGNLGNLDATNVSAFYNPRGALLIGHFQEVNFVADLGTLENADDMNDFAWDNFPADGRRHGLESE
ncbi:hypothetical protein MRB53_038096 [Persea americana]|nr:hypothetical protein MRB53_038096 [Persea americana]